MRQAQSIIRLLLLKQWDITCVVTIALLSIAAWSFLFPIGKGALLEGKKLAQSLSLISKADSLTVLAAAAKAEADTLDGIVKTIPDTQTVSEQAIPGYVYSLSNRCGLKASKVEIAKRVVTSESVQIPVTLVAEGNYGACGKFIDGLENGEVAVRLRDLDMKNSSLSRGLVTMFLDFVILSQK